MAENTVPIFAKLPLTVGMARIAAANTASDGSGVLVTLFTAGSNGSRVDKVVVTNSQAAAAASTAMVVKLFLSDAAGANPRMVGELALAAATRTTAVIGTTNTFSFTGGLFMKSGQILYVTQSVYAGAQDQNDVIVQQLGDY